MGGGANNLGLIGVVFFFTVTLALSLNFMSLLMVKGNEYCE